MIIDKETGRKLLDTTAGMHISIFVFGYPVTKTTFSGYILNDDGDYSIYKPRQWNHLCMSWSSGGPTKIVLVKKHGFFSAIAISLYNLLMTLTTFAYLNTF